MPRPATMNASAVRVQARKVRSFAKVNRASGSDSAGSAPGAGSRESSGTAIESHPPPFSALVKIGGRAYFRSPGIVPGAVSASRRGSACPGQIGDQDLDAVEDSLQPEVELLVPGVGLVQHARGGDGGQLREAQRIEQHAEQFAVAGHRVMRADPGGPDGRVDLALRGRVAAYIRGE